MKIAIFTDTFPPEINGVATSCSQLRKVLMSHGHTVYIFCTGEKSEFDLEEKIIRIKGKNLKKIYGYKLAFMFNHRISRLVKSLDLDLIHVQTEYGVGYMGHALAIKYKIPLVYTYHTMMEDYAYYVTHGHFDKLARKVVRKYIKYFSVTSDEVVSPSEATKKYLQSLKINKFVNVVPTGFDFMMFINSRKNKEKSLILRKTLQIPDNFKIFLCLGRIAKEKSFDVILRAFHAYLIKHPDLKAKLLVVGDGPYLDDLKRIGKEEELDEHVIYVGKVPYESVPDYYALSDIYLNASLTETQGLTYMEAMASGTILLVKETDCLKDVLFDGENGFYFNNSEDFEKKLNNILKLKDRELNKIRENALKTVDRYDIEKFYENIMNTYKRALRRGF